MKHQNRIQLSFGLVIAVFALVLATQSWFMNGYTSQVRGLLEDKLQLQQALQDARQAVLHIRADVWDTLLYHPGDRKTAIARLDSQAALFYQARRSLSGPLSQSTTQGIYTLDMDFRTYYLFAKEVLNLQDLGTFVRTRDHARKFQDNQIQLETHLDTLSAAIQGTFNETLTRLEEGSKAIFILTIVTPVLSILLAILFSAILSRGITRPLDRLGELATRASAGNYHLRTDLATDPRADNELRFLGMGFNHLLTEVESFREHMEELVAQRTSALEKNNTELRSTLDMLRSTQKQLIQSEKMAALGPLVAGVAHEVNTPIGNSITASSYLETRISRLRELLDTQQLKRSDLESFLEDSAELAAVTNTNLKRAGELIVSFKQVAVDQQNNERRRFDLRSYVSEIIMSHVPLLKPTAHEVLNLVDENLELDTYPGALYQILTNLLTNSLTHGFRDGRKGSIRIGATMKNGKVCLDYRDDGSGIMKEHRPHIFDPFYTTMHNEGGSGLGLYIALNQANTSLGGQLVLRDSPQPGVHFELVFPSVAAEAVQED